MARKKKTDRSGNLIAMISVGVASVFFLAFAVPFNTQNTPSPQHSSKGIASVPSISTETTVNVPHPGKHMISLKIDDTADGRPHYCVVTTDLGQETLGWIAGTISTDQKLVQAIYTDLDAGTHKLNHTIVCPSKGNKQDNTARNYPENFFVEVIDSANNKRILTSHMALQNNIVGYAPTSPAQ